MIVTKIDYEDEFKGRFLLLPSVIQKKAIKAENLFRQNAFHPSLRLHKLKGRLKEFWSISIDRKNRIIFKIMPDGVVLFISIGGHAIYGE